MTLTADGSLRQLVYPRVLESLTEALQKAMEAAVFPDRFEIDEQGPHSRLDALTEQLFESLAPKSGSNILELQETEHAKSIISDIVGRIKDSIR